MVYYADWVGLRLRGGHVGRDKLVGCGILILIIEFSPQEVHLAFAFMYFQHQARTCESMVELVFHATMLFVCLSIYFPAVLLLFYWCV